MPAKRILSGALAALLIAAIPARATSVPTFTLVDSIRPGAGSSGAMDYSASVALGDYLYFSATDGTSGVELWRSNGTTTERVKDINPSSSSNPQHFTVLGDYLYFTANDGTNGTELWRTDGTTASTTLVRDINIGGLLIPAAELIHSNFYSIQLRATAKVGNALTITVDIFDGTFDGAAGAVVSIVDSTTSATLYGETFGDYGTFASPGTHSETFTLDCSVNATLSITAQENSNAKIYIGSELAAQGGTAFGQYPSVTRTADVCSASVDSDPIALTTFGDYVYFQASDGITGDELWRTNGTTTERVKNINSGAANSNPLAFTALGDYLYFAAADGTNGNELWRTDGTEAGTTLVKDVMSGSQSSNPSRFTAFEGYLYFTAAVDGTSGYELWRTDGTEAGTTLVKDIYSGVNSSNPYDLTVFGDYLYFGADDGTAIGVELYRTDGTEAGTALVKDIRSGPLGATPSYLTVLGDHLYFAATDSANGWELWRTNGTEAGTARVSNIYPGAGDSYPAIFTPLGDYIYFTAYDVDRLGIWRTNGTTTENVPLPAGGGTPGVIDCDECFGQYMATVGDRLYTMTYSSAYGYEFAYLDQPPAELPETNRDGSLWTTTLVILAGLTAAASIGLLVRGAKRA
jgi:ELWxxDGT repeat protein